jgi:hypothetical protein
MNSLQSNQDDEFQTLSQTDTEYGIEPASVAGRLRAIGVLVLATAMVVLLAQGIGDTLPLITRNWALPFATVGFGLLGAYCGVSMRDERSGRALFAIATALYAIYMSQIGAQFFEMFHQHHGNHSDLMRCLAQLAVALVVQLPFAYFGFRILARPAVRPLLTVFTISSLALLVPIREGYSSLMLIGVLLAVALRLEDRYLSRLTALATPSGLIARLLVVLPLLIMVARRLVYPMSELGFATLLGITSAALYWLASRPQLPQSGPKVYLLATIALVGCWLALVEDCVAHMASVDSGIFLAVSWGGAAMLVGAAAEFATRHARGLRSMAALAALIAAIGAQYADGLLTISVFGIVVGGALALVGIRHRERQPLLAATVIAALSAYAFIAAIMHNIHMTPLVGLTILGTLLLITAGVAEKRGAAYAARARTFVHTLR